MYTVGEVSKISGVSVKTLHYYQKIGLLEPARIGENSYRYYETKEIDRLQSILFYRELQIPLEEIKILLDVDAKYSRVEVLKQHLNLIRSHQEKLSDIEKTLSLTLKKEEELVLMENKKVMNEKHSEKEELLKREKEKFKGFKPKDDIAIAGTYHTIMMAKPNAMEGLILCGIMLGIGIILLVFGFTPFLKGFFPWAELDSKGSILFVGIGLTVYGVIGVYFSIKNLFFTSTKEMLDDVAKTRYRTFDEDSESENE